MENKKIETPVKIIEIVNIKEIVNDCVKCKYQEFPFLHNHEEFKGINTDRLINDFFENYKKKHYNK
jgi:predicted nucleic-acid-binding Zn-ribbon protein